MNKKSFKVGDCVICVNTSSIEGLSAIDVSDRIEKGKKYIVEKVSEGRVRDLIWLKGVDFGAYPDRFVLFNNNPPAVEEIRFFD